MTDLETQVANVEAFMGVQRLWEIERLVESALALFAANISPTQGTSHE